MEGCGARALASRRLVSMFGRHILVLVPHPDDEVVACAAAIGRAQRLGAQVSTLYLTHGCIARETLWPWQRKNYEALLARRRTEGEVVAAFLGVAPVGWYPRPARSLWRELPAVLQEVEQAISLHTIDQVWVPAYEGGNADHDGLNAIGSVLRHSVSVLEFAEYNFFEGKAQAQRFPYLNGTEQVVSLSLDEMEVKRQALALYKSEQMNLGYVGAARECYRPLAEYDYSQPPHPGTLWYARHHWVPFRHPRVDFTTSGEVSDAITSFLRTAASALPGSAMSASPARKAPDHGSGG